MCKTQEALHYIIVDPLVHTLYCLKALEVLVLYLLFLWSIWYWWVGYLAVLQSRCWPLEREQAVGSG